MYVHEARAIEKHPVYRKPCRLATTKITTKKIALLSLLYQKHLLSSTTIFTTIFCIFDKLPRQFDASMQQSKIMIAKRNPLCYNAFAVAAWRNGRRTALKMRRETVSVQVRLPLLRLPGIAPGAFPLRHKGFRRSHFRSNIPVVLQKLKNDTNRDTRIGETYWFHKRIHRFFWHWI